MSEFRTYREIRKENLKTARDQAIRTAQAATQTLTAHGQDMEYFFHHSRFQFAPRQSLALLQNMNSELNLSVEARPAFPENAPAENLQQTAPLTKKQQSAAKAEKKALEKEETLLSMRQELYPEASDAAEMTQLLLQEQKLSALNLKAIHARKKADLSTCQTASEKLQVIAAADEAIVSEKKRLISLIPDTAEYTALRTKLSLELEQATLHFRLSRQAIPIEAMPAGEKQEEAKNRLILQKKEQSLKSFLKTEVKEPDVPASPETEETSKKVSLSNQGSEENENSTTGLKKEHSENEKKSSDLNKETADNEQKEFPESTAVSKQETTESNENTDLQKPLTKESSSLPGARITVTINGENLTLTNVGPVISEASDGASVYELEDKEHPLLQSTGETVYPKYRYRIADNRCGVPDPEGALLAEGASKLHQLLSTGQGLSTSTIMENGVLLGNVTKVSSSVKDPAAGNAPALDLKKWQETENRLPLPKEVADQLLVLHSVDWLLCNFQTSGEQLTKNDQGKLTSADTTQSFRMLFDSHCTSMNENYAPHTQEPIYNTMFQMYAAGEMDLDWNVLEEQLQKIEAMNTETFLQTVADPALKLRFGENSRKFRQAREKIRARKEGIRQEYQKFRAHLDEKRKLPYRAKELTKQGKEPYEKKIPGQTAKVSLSNRLICTKEEADRLVKSSNGFLTAKKREDEPGLFEIQPTLPTVLEVKDNDGKPYTIHPRKAYITYIQDLFRIFEYSKKDMNNFKNYAVERSFIFQGLSDDTNYDQKIGIKASLAAKNKKTIKEICLMYRIGCFGYNGADITETMKFALYYSKFQSKSVDVLAEELFQDVKASLQEKTDPNNDVQNDMEDFKKYLNAHYDEKKIKESIHQLLMNTSQEINRQYEEMQKILTLDPNGSELPLFENSKMHALLIDGLTRQSAVKKEQCASYNIGYDYHYIEANLDYWMKELKDVMDAVNDEETQKIRSLYQEGKRKECAKHLINRYDYFRRSDEQPVATVGISQNMLLTTESKNSNLNALYKCAFSTKKAAVGQYQKVDAPLSEEEKKTLTPNKLNIKNVETSIGNYYHQVPTLYTDFDSILSAYITGKKIFSKDLEQENTNNIKAQNQSNV